jgi:hypothetical protein
LLKPINRTYRESGDCSTYYIIATYSIAGMSRYPKGANIILLIKVGCDNYPLRLRCFQQRLWYMVDGVLVYGDNFSWLCT